MKITDMFAKKIERDIRGVVTVDQDDKQNAKQEVEEYVVTSELEKYFGIFFENYKKGISGSTVKTGVWISGFFGSGKSHFLKILSYLLDSSKEFDGKRPIDYFKNDNKIKSAMILADMELAMNVPTDVILFNIDSKSSADSKSHKEPITEVFLKVFNEMQGYCGSYPFLAEFERELDKEGKYGAFKEKFLEISGSVWEDKRQAFYFMQDKIVKTLVELGYYSEEAARNWCKNGSKEYEVSIDMFTDMVKDYCASKGSKHHLVFMVDEIGQYIGQNSPMMLNLQTIVEQLGDKCRGQAWVVVTSQQNIDDIIDVKGNDLSKIMGRFDTRLSLSAAFADEVIKERILKKGDSASTMLKLLYDEKETVLKNLLYFNDKSEKRNFADREEFALVYPFIPYQFQLASNVLTQLRVTGSSGKHLSDGERSMLAIFKDSAYAVREEQEGLLIPFNKFYDTLEGHIDHTYRMVITNAIKNTKIEDFDVEVLKVLFLVKSVTMITKNVENITTLMISKIDEDRIALQKKVQKALDNLVEQTFIQSNGDIYVFLSNEQQEINNRIKDESYETGDVVKEIGANVFQFIIKDSKYRYISVHNKRRYDFSYNQYIDGSVYGRNVGADIGIALVTPLSENGTEDEVRRISTFESNVYVRMAENSLYIKEIINYLRISNFILREGSKIDPIYGDIIEAKRKELGDIKSRIGKYVSTAINNADIFVNGEKVKSTARDSVGRIYDAMNQLISYKYGKLNYMETIPGQSDIEEIFAIQNPMQLETIMQGISNQNALDDVANTITVNTMRGVKSTVDIIKKKYAVAPYGFTDSDVEWILAVLYMQKRVEFILNSQVLLRSNLSTKELVNYVQKREFADKILIEKKEKPTEKQIKSVKVVMKDLFNLPSVSAEDDMLMKRFHEKSEEVIDKIQKLLDEDYKFIKGLPGERTVNNAKKELGKLLSYKNPMEFFKYVDLNQEELTTMGEELAPVLNFFVTEQKAIYLDAKKKIAIFEKSRKYVAIEELIDTVNKMESIVNKQAPYSEIRLLPELIDIFVDKQGAILDVEVEKVKPSLELDRSELLKDIYGKEYEDIFRNEISKQYSELMDRLLKSNEIPEVVNMKKESETSRDVFLKRIYLYEKKLAEEKAIAEKSALLEKLGNEEVSLPPIEENTQLLQKEKVEKFVSVRDLAIGTRMKLESELDVDNLVSQIKKQLMAKLDDESVIIFNV